MFRLLLAFALMTAPVGAQVIIDKNTSAKAGWLADPLTGQAIGTLANPLYTTGGIVTDTSALATSAKQDSQTSILSGLGTKLDAITTNTAADAPIPVTSVTGPVNLTAANQTVDVVLDGSASALWTLSSANFVGTVVAEGCVDAACTVSGGRLLFKSGVGSIGTNSVSLTGGTIAREYRVVSGGNRVRLRVSAYTSGTLTVRGYAQRDPNIVFVNGPVHTGEEEAVRAGRAFIVSSQVQAVTANNFLNATITNPAGSGVNVFVTARMFECNQATATTPAEWTTYANPTTVPTNSVTPSNRMLGGVAAQTQFRWQISGTALAGGTVGDNGTLLTGGGPTMNTIMTTLVPGQTGGVSIGGGGGGLAAAARCKVSYALYEESTN